MLSVKTQLMQACAGWHPCRRGCRCRSPSCPRTGRSRRRRRSSPAGDAKAGDDGGRPDIDAVHQRVVLAFHNYDLLMIMISEEWSPRTITISPGETSLTRDRLSSGPRISDALGQIIRTREGLPQRPFFLPFFIRFAPGPGCSHQALFAAVRAGIIR